MRDYPQHTIPTKQDTSDAMIEKIIQYPPVNPEIMRVDLEILKHLAKREQMIEDHNLYMGAIKEEK